MPKILIADDASPIRLVLSRILKRLACDLELLEAHDGESVMDSYFEYEPAVILLDVEMPDVNGWEILRCIRDIDQNTKIVMVTASESPEDVLKAIELGADGFVGKPFDQAELLDALDLGDLLALTA